MTDRRLGYLVLAVAVIALAVAVVLTNKLHNSQIDAAKANQAGCERANEGLRQPLYDFLSDAIRVRVRELQTLTGAQREADAIAVAGYRHERKAMVAAASDFPKFSGSPQVNCARAFPLP